MGRTNSIFSPFSNPRTRDTTDSTRQYVHTELILRRLTALRFYYLYFKTPNPDI